MATDPEVHSYAPIGNQPRAFRLLRLKSGAGARLEAELIQTTIDKADYEAISYTWGDPAIEDFIYIDGKPLGITYNLSMILRDLRAPDDGEDRTFWNDATCINQSDLTEQGQQVQQMGEIFRSARRVLFCISRPMELTDFFFDTLNDFWEQVPLETKDQLRNGLKNEDDCQHTNLHLQWQKFTDELALDNYMTMQRLKRAFVAMTSDPWFRRVWIVQEVSNARDGVVLCGRRSMPAFVFAICGSFITAMEDLQLHAQPLVKVMSSITGNQTPTSLNRRKLHDLISTFSMCEATNEYDRIYALLGMATDTNTSTSMLPNYTLEIKQVLESAIRHICSSHETFTEPLPFETIDEFIADLREPQDSKLPHWAAAQGHMSILKYMVRAGFDPSSYQVNRRCQWTTLLYQAATHGHIAIVQWLLTDHQVDPDDTANQSETPLCEAARHGHAEIVRLLLATGKVSVIPTHRRTGSPLHYAVDAGHESVVKLLLAHDDTAFGVWYRRCSLLIAAVHRKNYNMTKLLIEAGVNFNAVDHNHETALFLTARIGKADITELLLSVEGVNLELRNRYNKRTALHEAAHHGQSAIVKLLLDTGRVDINARDLNGLTPLDHARECGNEEIVQLLLGSGQVCKSVLDDPDISRSMIKTFI